MCYAPLREIQHFGVFASFLFYSLATSNARKNLVSRFWAPTTAVWCTRRPNTPRQEHLKFHGLYFRPRSCSCPQVKCKRSVGGLFFVSFRAPKKSTNFDHWSTFKSRCRPSLRTGGRANLQRNTNCCDEPLSSHRRSPVSTNQPKF